MTTQAKPEKEAGRELGSPCGKVFVTLSEAASRLGVPPQWLADQAAAGRVPHINDGHELLFNVGQVTASLLAIASSNSNGSASATNADKNAPLPPETPVFLLNIPMHMARRLVEADILTLGELASKSPSELSSIRYFGPVSVRAVQMAVEDAKNGRMAPAEDRRPKTVGEASIWWFNIEYPQWHALYDRGIQTIADLTRMTPRMLAEIPGLDYATLRTIQQSLSRLGLKLAQEDASENNGCDK